MDAYIDDQTKSDVLQLVFDDGESLTVRKRAVVSKTGKVTVQSQNDKAKGRLESLFSGEKLPLIQMNSKGSNQNAMLSPPLFGVIEELTPVANELKVQSLSFLCADASYEVDFASDELYESDILATVTFSNGNGPIFVSGVSGIIPIELSQGEKTTLQSDHVAAFDGTVTHSGGNKTLGGLLGDTTGGLTEFRGPGTVYVHARSPIRVTRSLNILSGYTN